MNRSDCEYVTVRSKSDTSNLDCGADDIQNKSVKPFLRQLLVCSTLWSQYFLCGLCYGSTTVIIPQMRAEHGQQYISQEMASWISSIMGFTPIPWPIILVMLSSYIGRRNTYAFGAVTAVTGFVIMVASNSPQYLLASYIVQGPMTAMQVSICLLVMTEYTSPHYRGVFLTIKSATFYWGIWVANAIGTFTHWRYIAALGLVCGAYNVATLFAWPESPYWLASKGRLEQCMTSHRWLKGVNTKSEKELQCLITAHQQKSTNEDEDKLFAKSNNSDKFQKIWIQLKSKCFYKCIILSITLSCQYHLSGKMVCSIYAIDIIKNITHSESEAYKGMLILDGVTVLGMYVGCYLSKILSRRVLLLSAGGTASVFLMLMSIYLYLVKFNILSANNVLTIIVLTFYSLSISCGPIILNASMTAELFPLKMRDATAAIIAMIVSAITGITLKVAPLLFSNLGMHGTFLFYGMCSGTLLLVLYMYLPETKDKSLNEIEVMMLGVNNKSEESKDSALKSQTIACSASHVKGFVH